MGIVGVGETKVAVGTDVVVAVRSSWGVLDGTGTEMFFSPTQAERIRQSAIERMINDFFIVFLVKPASDGCKCKLRPVFFVINSCGQLSACVHLHQMIAVIAAFEQIQVAALEIEVSDLPTGPRHEGTVEIHVLFG